MIEAIEGLPDYLRSVYINGIYRLQRSKDNSNPATNSNKNEIVLYDEAFSKSRNLGRIVAHEFAHQHYAALTNEERLDYRLATGWNVRVGKNRVYYSERRESGYIEPDGMSSANEDYANNLEHFIFNSDKLKKITPSAYYWFSKRYGTKFKK